METSRKTQLRRISSLSRSVCEKPTKGTDDNKDEETGTPTEETGAPALRSDATNVSSFKTLRSRAHATSSGEEKSWWNHFFDHFLDGSAGVMYTSFLGLIIDEIVNFGASKYK